jgi:hypothetical protein
MTKANVVVLHRDCRPAKPSWTAALRTRLAAVGARRRAALAPERWSVHMLRDVGLADLADETPRVAMMTQTGWPVR